MFSSAGTPFSYERPLNGVDFRRCLSEDLALALTPLAGDEIPILHLSVHGYVLPRSGSRPSPSGLALRSGERIGWPELRKAVSTLNDAFAGRLILCLSVCDGIQADAIAMRTDRSDPPFYAVVANSKAVKVADSERAFVAFYTLLLAGAALEKAVRGMRIASGNENFVLHYGDQTTGPFIQLMESIRDGRLGDVLRERYRPHWQAIR